MIHIAGPDDTKRIVERNTQKLDSCITERRIARQTYEKMKWVCFYISQLVAEELRIGVIADDIRQSFDHKNQRYKQPVNNVEISRR